MNVLATLHQLRQRLGLSASDTAEDARLLAALQAATAQIENTAGRQFSPRLATLAHTIHPRYPQELLLDDDLLRLDSILNGDGSSIDPLDVVTLPDAGLDGPTRVLRLTAGQTFTWVDTPLRSVSITGIWGWHDRWSRAWRDSADTVQNDPLDSTSSTMVVNDADGADGYAVPPRFQVGQLLRIEEEYLRLLAVDAGSNGLTVLRGVNGTTAAAHAQGTTIDVFQPAAEVEMLCLRWALWLYKEPDGRGFAVTPAALTAALGGLRRVG